MDLCSYRPYTLCHAGYGAFGPRGGGGGLIQLLIQGYIGSSIAEYIWGGGGGSKQLKIPPGGGFGRRCKISYIYFWRGRGGAYSYTTRGGSRICGRGGAQRLPRAPQARRFLEGPV